MDRVRLVALLMLAGYGAGLGFALVNSSAEPASLLVGFLRDVLTAWGAPSAVTAASEFMANTAIFVPLPLLGAVAFGPRRVLTWVAIGLGVSVAVELVQLVVFTGSRTASVVDVVSNTLGALVGALLAQVGAALLAREHVGS